MMESDSIKNVPPDQVYIRRVTDQETRPKWDTNIHILHDCRTTFFLLSLIAHFLLHNSVNASWFCFNKKNYTFPGVEADAHGFEMEMSMKLPNPELKCSCRNVQM
jgi:hypothetical protein